VSARNRKLAVAWTLLSFSTALACAQDHYPSKPIHFILAQPPGGAVDLVSRALAIQLSETLHQPVVVDNQPGGNGGLAGGLVARAAPDGYTLFMAVDNNLTLNPHIYPGLPYKPLTDFAPVSVVARSRLVLTARKSLEANTVPELIALAKADPGKLTYASTGVGGTPHVGMELFQLLTKTRMTHVPYRGTPQAMTDLISGVVDLFLIGQSSAKAQSGLIKNLAITSATRSPLMPDLPTMQESGVPGYELRGWFGMLAPAKTPQPVIDILSQAVKTAAADPRFVQALVPEGLEILANSPDDMRAMIAAETAKWGEVVKATGVKLEQ
jgi:tripartite-type tricarboxylate transporter receptor subunit TctC